MNDNLEQNTDVLLPICILFLYAFVKGSIGYTMMQNYFQNADKIIFLFAGFGMVISIILICVFILLLSYVAYITAVLTIELSAKRTNVLSFGALIYYWYFALLPSVVFGVILLFDDNLIQSNQLVYSINTAFEVIFIIWGIWLLWDRFKLPLWTACFSITFPFLLSSFFKNLLQ